MANPIQFIKEVRAELSKVVWPTRREVLRITMAVVAISLVMAVYLGLIDMGLTEAIQSIVNR